MRILIAEDDFASRRFLEILLSQYGDCFSVVDGLEMLKVFYNGLKDNKIFDLICIDIMLPKVDGIKALSVIRETEKKMKVSQKSIIIMTSALNDDEIIKKCYQEGCNEYLWKPIKSEIIKKSIESLV